MMVPDTLKHLQGPWEPLRNVFQALTELGSKDAGLTRCASFKHCKQNRATSGTIFFTNHGIREPHFDLGLPSSLRNLLHVLKIFVQSLIPLLDRISSQISFTGLP